MLAGYDQLLTAAARLRWDAEMIDLAGDRPALARLSAETRGRLATLVAGFVLAEHAVADALSPYVTAAGADPRAAECFAVQAADEARHARFFDRVAGELLDGRPGPPPPGIAALFLATLPAMARRLAADADLLGEAVGLYHLVLEGIVFAVGQAALTELAEEHGLAGLADGVRRVAGDERWHVGLGVLALSRAGASVDVDDAARLASRAWGARIATPDRVERALAVHARRLAVLAGENRSLDRSAPGSGGGSNN